MGSSCLAGCGTPNKVTGESLEFLGVIVSQRNHAYKVAYRSGELIVFEFHGVTLSGCK